MNIIYHHRTRGRDVEKVHINGIANGLKKLGHNVYILSPPGVTIDNPKADAKASESIQPPKGGFPWSRIAARMPEILFELMEIFYNFISYFRIKKLYKKHNIDAIYERYFLFSLATIFFAQRAGIPVILEINDASFVPRVRKLKMKRLAAFIEKYTFKRAYGIVAVSSRFSDLIASQGIDPDKIWTMPNAVDPDIFSGDISGIPVREKHNLNGQCVVGFIGSMVPWHGLHSLLKSARGIVQENENILFLLVGDFERLGQESIKIANELKDNIVLAGRVPYNEVPGYVAAMDIAIMPDSNEYGSPMKIFEYMAMGKPTIAPDLGPLREIIDHGVNGLLIRPGDPDDIKGNILQLVKNENLRRQLGSNAAKAIISSHTWDINSQKIMRIFNGNA